MKSKLVEKIHNWRTVFRSFRSPQSKSGPIKLLDPPFVVQDRAWKRERVLPEDLFGCTPTHNDRAG